MERQRESERRPAAVRVAVGMGWMVLASAAAALLGLAISYLTALAVRLAGG